MTIVISQVTCTFSIFYNILHIHIRSTLVEPRNFVQLTFLALPECLQMKFPHRSGPLQKRKQTPQLLFRLQQSLLRTLHVYLFILYTYFSLQFVRPTCPPKFVLNNCRHITLSQYMPKKRYDYWFYISFICQRCQVQGPADRFIQKNMSHLRKSSTYNFGNTNKTLNERILKCIFACVQLTDL